ncbi:MAG: DUF4384 domain-containing protein [Proteobacteria bacterium]|nr:DUF4384 domain-containing protein [Pseudomonadota bacterium]MBU1736906.1 DUF4384 domain-containing protein [Pseudomonadota bacterium]
MSVNTSGALFRKILWSTLLAAFLPLVVSCGGMDPRDVDVELEESAPEVKITSYNKALSELGIMTGVYDTGLVNIMSTDIADNTGTAATTGGEIQRNITEIMKSTLNSIGGGVGYVPYDPAFIQNQMVTGYSSFENKIKPDVVLTGGITEFDRGLETRGEGMDAAATANIKGIKTSLPSEQVGANFGNTGKTGKARITIDFNMIDPNTLTGIPKMTTTNSMEVHKAMKEKEIGLTLFGPTFGLKGSVKKVQGRHEAVRLLVQVSMVQMIGKYLNLPYWRLLGDDANPDPIVLESLEEIYYSMDDAAKTAAVQQWLYIHGYDLQMTGQLDSQTEAALAKFDPAYQIGSKKISKDQFIAIYTTMPFRDEARARRKALNNILYEAAMAAEANAASTPQVAAAPVAQNVETAVYADQEIAQAQAAPAAQPEAAPAPAAAPKRAGFGFGRKLKDDEW